MNEYTLDQLVERIAKALRKMDGDSVTDLCNTEFGMGIKYDGDGVWSDDSTAEDE